jgi:hypothetical protein
VKGTILKTDKVVGRLAPILFWNLNYFEEDFVKQYTKKKRGRPKKIKG